MRCIAHVLHTAGFQEESDEILCPNGALGPAMPLKCLLRLVTDVKKSYT